VQSQPPIEKEPILLSNTKYPVQLARDFVLAIPVEGTRDTYKSRINVLIKLLCKEKDDFMCIYKEKSIEIIKKKYKNPDQYIMFMLFMIDEVPEIKNRVPIKLVALLRKAAVTTKAKSDANTVRKNEERAKNTDYNTEYENMITKDTTALNDMENLIRVFYISGIYNNANKLRMIPRNYLFDVKLIKTLKENDKIHNFYILSTGKLIINDFKTQKKYEPIEYNIDKKVKEMISQNLKKDPREYLFGQHKRNDFNKIISKSLGTGIDDYRRIMKAHHLKDNQYSLEYIADVMKNSVGSGKISY
jgi:hypothetical protein